MKPRIFKWLATILLSVFMLIPGVSLPGQQPAPQFADQPKQETVYITRTGKKYHRDGCRYLAMRTMASPVVPVRK